MECERNILTNRIQGVEIPLTENELGRYDLSVVAFGKGPRLDQMGGFGHTSGFVEWKFALALYERWALSL